jgi:hypothetical protein
MSSRALSRPTLTDVTFTILVTHPDGKACVLAAGQDFEEVSDHLQIFDPQA